MQKKYQSRQNKIYEDDGEESDVEEDNSQQIVPPVQADGESDEGVVQRKPNSRFNRYKDLFNNLVNNKVVPTMYPIQSVIITYNSKYAVTVTKKDEKEYWVKMYSLSTYDLAFEEQIGGQDDDYIKLKEVEQNNKGDKFAMVYFNDGLFKLRTFEIDSEKVTRDEKEIKDNELDINNLLKLNNWTMAISGFPDPYITCCFIDNDRLFIDLFYNYDLTHIHFVYDIKQKKVLGEVVKMQLDCSQKNFPYKCFYNDEKKEIYSFYRQGHTFKVMLKEDDPKSWTYQYEKMTDMDLGQMYLVYNQALVVRSSSNILFFKQVYDDLAEEFRWVQYNVIEARGFIYYIKGNVRIQITCEDLIYFYKIDPETLMPQLENVMYNYMNCTQMMFGTKVRYGITYKTNQKSFNVYTREFQHNFKVNILNKNLNGSKGVEFEKLGVFFVTEVDKVLMYKTDTY
jgi:hypothetical protein